MAVNSPRAALKDLAAIGTPNQIAEYLRTRAIKGVKGGGETGLLAAYLKFTSAYDPGQKLTGFRFFDVSTSFYVLRTVGVFIYLFERGRYPLLEA